MKLGPERTQQGKFQGFGLKPAAGAAPGSSASSSSRAPTAPATRGSAASRAKAAQGGITSLFRESLEDDEADGGKKVRGLPTWSKPTAEAVQAQRQAEVLQAADPSVFQYDEVIEDVKRDMDIDPGPMQQLRTDALEQKKRVGLTVRRGAEAVQAGSKRDAKYIEKVIVAVERRKVEQQIVEDRLLKKEQNERKDKEVFVTEAFKEELKRRKKFEEELEAQDVRDARKEASKQEDGRGFADMYRNLLNGGMASSRGGEKVLERAAPREELEESGAKKEEEDEEKIKMEDVKAEDTEADGQAQAGELGVKDVEAAPIEAPVETQEAKKAREAAEKEQREEKAMSAKERYLARKRAAAADAS